MSTLEEWRQNARPSPLSTHYWLSRLHKTVTILGTCSDSSQMPLWFSTTHCWQNGSRI
jgi:hypothetical protein